MPDDVVNQLKQIPLFAKLRRNDLREVAKLVKRAQYPVGTKICQQGRLGSTAYLVEDGKLRVLHVDPQGIEREVAQLGPGSFLGETSLLLGEPRDATIEVVQDATLLSLDKDELDQLLYERPSMLRVLQMSSEVARKRHARRFKWQDPDEVVILSMRKHNMILMRHLAFPTFVLLVDLFGCGYWWSTLSGGKLALITGTLLGLVPLLFILYLVLDHQNDNYIVTSKRVVHEERVLIFRESRVEAPLSAVQDIQESQEGMLAQMYNFGNLIIETAGERGHVVFREIPHPEETRKMIFEQIQRVQAGAKAEELAAIRDTMRRHFGIQPVEEQAAAPVPPQKKKCRLKLTMPLWLLAPLRLITYFLPPLRHEQGDTITWRKHWIALIKHITLPTLLIAGVTFFAVFLIHRDSADWAPILIGYGTAIVFLFPWWLWRFDDWQNDIYQVTTTRIIDVERLPFYLREDRREASLGMIQNISLEIPGFLGRFLNYGSVTIETAGAGAFTFDLVRDPRGVQAEIFRRVEAFQQRQRQQEAERRRTELLDWFTVYDQIRPSTSPTTQPPSSYQQES
ncbi:MAG: cyclic nucleotide-binding domain-containing protein [Anaerolineae bacterium]